MKNLLLNRELESHKGSYGRLAIISGSKGMTGSSCLVAKSALRTGSGLVYLLAPKSLVDILSIKLTEPIIYALEDNDSGHFISICFDEILEKLNKMDVLVLGPGIGICEDRKILIKKLIKSVEIPIVLDADGLNCIAGELDVLKLKKSNLVITPHPGEMARLLNIKTDKVQENREKIAGEFAEKYNVTVVLKGKNTVVASNDKDIFINMTGNPGMATAGSGDVLSGVLGSLIGQGLDINTASKLAVYIHGLAGDISAKDKGEHGVIASDIMENIPYAIKSILS